MSGATPVAREGARPAMELAREFIHARWNRCPLPTDVEALADLIEADRASRDASAVEVERTMREALERIARAGDERMGASAGAALLGRHASRALARVTSLKGGTR